MQLVKDGDIGDEGGEGLVVDEAPSDWDDGVPCLFGLGGWCLRECVVVVPYFLVRSYRHYCLSISTTVFVKGKRDGRKRPSGE